MYWYRWGTEYYYIYTSATKYYYKWYNNEEYKAQVNNKRRWTYSKNDSLIDTRICIITVQAIFHTNTDTSSTFYVIVIFVNKNESTNTDFSRIFNISTDLSFKWWNQLGLILIRESRHFHFFIFDVPLFVIPLWCRIIESWKGVRLLTWNFKKTVTETTAATTSWATCPNEYAKR